MSVTATRRTPKPRTRPTRTLVFHRVTARFASLNLKMVEANGRVRENDYYVESAPGMPDVFVLTKYRTQQTPGEDSVYEVTLVRERQKDGSLPWVGRCNCRGHRTHGHCKHAASMVVLRMRGSI